MEDQFESKLADVVKPVALCTPARKNDEGVVDLDTHLEAYKIRDRLTKPPQSKFVRRRHTVENQLGKLVVDVRKLDRLLMPTGKQLDDGVPEVPAGGSVDHYACYAVTVAKSPKGQPAFPKFTPVDVFVEDQFGKRRVRLQQPARLCAPASQDGDEIGQPANHLTCYKTTLVLTEPPQPSVGRTHVFLNNQFGPEVLDRTGLLEFCITSLKGLAP